MLVGCSSSPDRVTPKTTLKASDFAPRGAGEVRSRVVVPDGGVLDVNEAPGRGAVRAADITGPVGASGGITDAVGHAGSPLGASDSEAVTAAVLVEAKVGDVNGRPILARTFFEAGTPTQEALGPRLAAESRTRTRDDWVLYAREQINERLDEYIRDELLRAEALSSLTPDEKMGLFALVERMQSDLRREAGGSREQLKRQLETEKGLTVDQWARKTEQMLLTRRELELKIKRGINVSWRDIEQAYAGRFKDLYQHPPRYKMYLVTMPASETADRAAMEQAIASGRPFEELAAGSLNRFKNDRGGLEVREVPGALAAASFFPNPTLDQAAKALGEGQTSPTVDMGDTIAWVHLATIERAPTLYNAQLDIESRLLNQRQDAALKRYLTRLAGKANVSSIPQMRARLLQIAVARYGPG